MRSHHIQEQTEPTLFPSNGATNSRCSWASPLCRGCRQWCTFCQCRPENYSGGKEKKNIALNLCRRRLLMPHCPGRGHVLTYCVEVLKLLHRKSAHYPAGPPLSFSCKCTTLNFEVTYKIEHNANKEKSTTSRLSAVCSQSQTTGTRNNDFFS